MKPTDTLQDTLQGLLDELGSEPVVLAPELELERDLGLGSLEVTELFARLERMFETTFPDRALVDVRSVADLQHALDEALTGGRSPKTHAEMVRARAPTGDVPEPSAFFGTPPNAETILDAARYRAMMTPDEVHARVLDELGEVEAVTFSDLWSRVLKVGGGLASSGIRPGDRVALVLPTCSDFLAAFLGIQSAGAVAVPIYPPIRLDEIASYLTRHARLLQNAGVRALVTDAQILPVARLLQDRVASLDFVARVADFDVDIGFGAVRVSPDALGLIQYSSGSTGLPKGVALRHGTLVSNMKANAHGLDLVAEDVCVSWLPLYHDMGLIGAWLSALFQSTPFVLLSPLHFLSRPERWLWAFHRFHGTISPAPNFGYELCFRKVQDHQIEGLDLSSWKAAMNGTEPVREPTIERFCTRFAPYGFRREAMTPVYGLAETCVGLTFTPTLRGPRIERVDRETFLDARRAVPSADGDTEHERLAFISCGRPLEGHEVRVVDPADMHGAEVGDREEGRIQFRGPSTMDCYFNAPEATDAVRAGDGWIDTGDLGYVANGELYVTGRIKDLIVKGGRKYHPHDVENAAQTVAGIRAGCVVAFAAPDDRGAESMVILCETREEKKRHDVLRKAVTAAVFDHIGTSPDRVVMLPPRSMLKTSSGKLQRTAMRARFMAGNAEIRTTPPPKWRAYLEIAARSAPGRIARLARQGAKLAYGAYATAVNGFMVLGGSVVIVLACRSEHGAHDVARGFLRTACRLTGLTPEVQGQLPEGRVLLVSNHASNLDALVLTVCFDRDLTFTVKNVAFDDSLLGRALARLGHLPIDRSTASKRLEGYRLTREAVEAGRLVHVFPEATITPAAGLRPFRLGAFKLAVELGVPIVPIVIRGTRRVLRDEARRFHWAPIEVDVLEPIAPQGDGFSEATRLRALVRERIASRLGDDEPDLVIQSAALPPGTKLSPEGA